MSPHSGGPEGAIGRLLHDLTVGTHQAIRRKERADAENKLHEIDQQYQFAISGVATGSITFSSVTVPFDHALYYAPGQRDSTLEFPHFTYGSHTKPAVGVHATVEKWLRDETNGAIIGAVVAVGVVGEGEFTGFVHLTFQGFGALVEEDQTPLVGEG